MKTKFIKDNTFGTYIDLFWDCTEQEFCDRHNKNSEFEINPTGAFGKLAHIEEGGNIDVKVWINRKNNIETLSHEILHAVRYWLQDYQNITLSRETEEIYTGLHSYFMRQCLIALEHKRLIA